MGENVVKLGRLLGVIAKAVFQFVWKWLKVGGRWMSKQWHLARVSRRRKDLEKQKLAQYQLMGEKVYVLFQRNNVRHRELLVLCEGVRNLELEIDETERQRIQILAMPLVEPKKPTLAEVADEPLELRETLET